MMGPPLPQASPPHHAPPPPQPQRQMRGPVAVDDILSDLQNRAFSGHSTQIEVISNASESELSELLDDVVAVDATRGRRRAGGIKVR
jgi:hypothetical protein